MTAELPLKENVFTTHTFSTFKINSSSVSNRFSYSKKNFGSGTTVLIISDKEMDDIIRIVKSLEESGLLIKDMTKTIKK